MGYNASGRSVTGESFIANRKFQYVSVVQTPLHAPIPTEVNKNDKLIMSDQWDRNGLTKTYRGLGSNQTFNILKTTSPADTLEKR